MADPIEAARRYLAGYDDADTDADAHLRASLARVDELTAEVERLRMAGLTCTRGTECHVTRGGTS